MNLYIMEKEIYMLKVQKLSRWQYSRMLSFCTDCCKQYFCIHKHCCTHPKCRLLKKHTFFECCYCVGTSDIVIHISSRGYELPIGLYLLAMTRSLYTYRLQYFLEFCLHEITWKKMTRGDPRSVFMTCSHENWQQMTCGKFHTCAML